MEAKAEAAAVANLMVEVQGKDGEEMETGTTGTLVDTHGGKFPTATRHPWFSTQSSKRLAIFR
jgi:hypothetical protein